MSRFPFLAQRLFNVPLAIHPNKAEIVMAAMLPTTRVGTPISPPDQPAGASTSTATSLRETL